MKRMVSVSLGLLLCCTGCASLSHQDVHNAARWVNRTDGITQAEAVVLAQQFILDKGLADQLYTLKPFRVQHKHVWMRDGKQVEMVEVSTDFVPKVKSFWVVLFRNRQGSLFWGAYPVMPFYVTIGAHYGDVQDWGVQH